MVLPKMCKNLHAMVAPTKISIWHDDDDEGSRNEDIQELRMKE